MLRTPGPYYIFRVYTHTHISCINTCLYVYMHENSCTNTFTYTRVRVCACSGCAQVCMDVSYGCLPHNEKGLIYDIQAMSCFQKLSSTSPIHTQEKDLHAAAKTPGRRVERWQFVLHHVCVLSEHACMQTTKWRYVHVVVYIPSPITPYHPSPRRQCLVNVKHYARDVCLKWKKWKINSCQTEVCVREFSSGWLHRTLQVGE